MKRWLLIAAFVALPGCEASKHGAMSAGEMFPTAIGKLIDNPSISGAAEFVASIAGAFVVGALGGGVVGHHRGKRVERHRSKKAVASGASP